MATRPIQTVTLVPTLAPAWTSAACACVLIVASSPKTRGLILHRHQINQRKHEHPDQVHEVPVEAVHFYVLGRKLPSSKTGSHNPEIDDADHNVCHVEAGDAEKRGAEQRGTFGIARNCKVLHR